MIKKLIQNHIQKLTIQDIYDFAIKNGVHLKEEEAYIIYYQIKQNWEELIFHDHMNVLVKVKDSLEKETYEKALALIIFFKEKYKSYL